MLLDAHRRLRWRNATWWLGHLVAYAPFTTIRGEILAAPDCPYPFADLAGLGWGGLLMNVAMYGVGFYVLGMAIVAVDRRTRTRALAGSADADDTVALSAEPTAWRPGPVPTAVVRV